MRQLSRCVWTAIIILTAFAPTLCTAQEVPTAEEQIEIAQQIERDKYWDDARDAWERVIDTCDSTDEQLSLARRHLHILNISVPPDIDPEKANVWRAYVAILRVFDFKWTPKDSEEEKHVRIELSDEDVELLKRGFHRFTEHVFAFSRGCLRIEYEIDVIEEPLTRIAGEDRFWLAPWDVEELIEGRYAKGEVDSVFAYVKMSDGKGQEVPGAMFGGAYGGDMGPAGAGWSGFMWRSEWMKGDGEVELHEWLHQVDWAFTHRLRYPDALAPNPDDGRMEGKEGGHEDYRRKPEEPNWMRYYQHMMSECITSKMWREARCRPWEGVEYARNWLIVGPFAYEGDYEPAMEATCPWDAAKAPAEGDELAGKSWKALNSEDDYVDLNGAFEDANDAVAWAFATVHSDRERDTHLWLGYDDSIVAYVNGKEVYRFVGPQAARQDHIPAPIHLNEGENTVALKVLDISADWGFYARLGDEIGRAVDGVKWQ